MLRFGGDADHCPGQAGARGAGVVAEAGGGQKQQIKVVPETEVVTPLMATFADIQPGQRVFAAGTPGPDLLVAQSITILTQPPVIRAQ